MYNSEKKHDCPKYTFWYKIYSQRKYCILSDILLQFAIFGLAELDLNLLRLSMRRLKYFCHIWHMYWTCNGYKKILVTMTICCDVNKCITLDQFENITTSVPDSNCYHFVLILFVQLQEMNNVQLTLHILSANWPHMVIIPQNTKKNIHHYIWHNCISIHRKSIYIRII